MFLDAAEFQWRQDQGWRTRRAKGYMMGVTVGRSYLDPTLLRRAQYYSCSKTGCCRPHALAMNRSALPCSMIEKRSSHVPDRPI